MAQQQPLSSAAVIAQSDLLIERHRLDQARALLAQALKANPDDEELLHRLALIDYLEEDHGAALDTIQRLLSRTPSHYGGRCLHAAILERRKQLADAESVWLGLIRDFPESADLYASYARLMLSTLNLTKAQRLAAEALRLEPEQDAALFVMAMCDLIAGTKGQRSHHLETLVRERPENAATMITLILALQDRSDWRGALRLAQEILRSRPTDADYVDLVRELKVETHWSMVPLYPMRRWGWAGSFGMWLAGIVGLNVLSRVVAPPVIITLGLLWFVYVVYSWVWPAQLKRLL